MLHREEIIGIFSIADKIVDEPLIKLLSVENNEVRNAACL